MPFISVDFPDPDTPVITVSFDMGILISIFFKLLPSAPFRQIFFPLPSLFIFLFFFFSFFDNYFPVKELDFNNSLYVPLNVIYPPF